MKSLRSIINKLSHNEIGTFRMFLSSHSRNGKSKKLELFDHLVNQTLNSASPAMTDSSRQSVYQLKKRLTEELYAFLLTQDQGKDCNDRSFLEMECHKKLYCFKILFDKGIHDHASQMLNEVLTTALKHSFHSIYLEAVNLKNIYFPLAQTGTVKQVPVSQEIKKLKRSLGRNLYVNQYLAEAGGSLHESDRGFRTRLMDKLADFSLTDNEPLIDRLLEVNHLFCQGNFHSAYHRLLEFLENNSDISGDRNMLSLMHIELAKACLCMNELADVRRWLPLQAFSPFSHLLVELQFIFAMRTGDAESLKGIVEQSRRLRVINENAILSAKWSFYALLASFRARDFKKVIKSANGDMALSFKDKSWLMNVKMLEILSIYELNDSDWLYYRIESFRKVLSGSELKQQRISQIVNLLKVQVSGKGQPQSDTFEKLRRIGEEYPWHPLSNEVFDYCAYLREALGADSSSQTCTQVYAKISC